jgi:sugar phosphate isomerase/epimerase
MSSVGINRRQFVGTAALAAAGLIGTTPEAVRAQPKTPAGKPGIKVGLYSITFLGVWYQGKALTLEQMIQKAKQYGYDGIEIDGKRPHGNPNDWPTKRCKQLRSMADGEGIEIYAVAGNNDFSSPICEHREAQIVYLRELIRMASDFGAPAVRVFFAWTGVTKHPQLASYTVARNIWDHTHTLTTGGDDWNRVRDGLVECARYAAD